MTLDCGLGRSSPDLENIYDGNITTDENGEAVVELSGYFEALDSGSVSAHCDWHVRTQAVIADEIKDNRFVIQTRAERESLVASDGHSSGRVDEKSRKGGGRRVRTLSRVLPPSRGFRSTPRARHRPGST